MSTCTKRIWDVYHGASCGEKSEVWRQGSQKICVSKFFAALGAKLHLFFATRSTVIMPFFSRLALWLNQLNLIQNIST